MPRWPGHAVLQVPVPGLESFVRARTAHYDPGFLGCSEVAGEPYVHAHVTVLTPFDSLPPMEVVREVAAQVSSFDYLLASIDVFPNGIIHAVPEPDVPFRALTAAAQEAFPHVLHQGGRHPVHPHVTLDAIGPGVDVEWVRRRTSRVLPCTARAEALDLAWYEQGNTRLVGRLRLG